MQGKGGYNVNDLCMNEGLPWQEAFEPWIWPSTLAHFHSRKCFSYNKFSILITIHVVCF